MTEEKYSGSVVVVGGGVAGIQAALDLADSGFFVYLVEKSGAIGTGMAQLDKTFPTNDCSMCIIAPILVSCSRHPNIKIMSLSEVTGIAGTTGNFTVTVTEQPRYVDPENVFPAVSVQKRVQTVLKMSSTRPLPTARLSSSVTHRRYQPVTR